MPGRTQAAEKKRGRQKEKASPDEQEDNELQHEVHEDHSRRTHRSRPRRRREKRSSQRRMDRPRRREVQTCDLRDLVSGYISTRKVRCACCGLAGEEGATGIWRTATPPPQNNKPPGAACYPGAI
jgi:hypothetical protein